MDKLIVTAGFALFFAVLGLVGNMDYEDQVLEQKQYAKMVCAGHWPDFNDISPKCE